MKIQKRLLLLGFNPGPIDGVRGRLTLGAIRAFQRSKGMVDDDLVGPVTHRALFAMAGGAELPSFDSLPCFDEANRLMGTREIAGPASSATILDWAEELSLSYGDDDIPWCGLFVAHCTSAALPAEPLPNNPLGARQWLTFGEVCKLQLAAVMIFWRGSRSGWQGHVGLCAGEDAKTYHILGGNPSNAVNIRRINKTRFLGARWPLTGPAQGGIVLAGRDDVLSSDGNEA